MKNNINTDRFNASKININNINRDWSYTSSFTYRLNENDDQLISRIIVNAFIIADIINTETCKESRNGISQIDISEYRSISERN